MEKTSLKNSKDGSVEELFGKVLRQLRKENGLSQEELAFESGCHRTYISLLERGKKSPSLKTIFQLANAFHIEPSNIIERVQKLGTLPSRKEQTRGRTQK